MCPPWLGCCVRLAKLVSCLPICLPPGFVFHLGFVSHLALSPSFLSPICSPSGFVFHLGWGAVSASLGLSPVSQFVSQFVFHLGWGAVSASLGLSPNLSPIWLCLPVFSPDLFPIWLCLSPWLGCCVRFGGLVSCLPICLSICLPICLPSGFVSQFCLPICSPSGFVFHLGWGAVSASLGLSGLVSQFVSHLALSPSFVSPFVPHLALSFTLARAPCPPPWACLPICLPSSLPSGFVFHLGWGAVSALLGLSPNLSPTWLCLSPWLGCCVRLAGLVSQFVSHLSLSFTLAGVLCPPRSACLRSCLPICLPSGFVSQFSLPICFPSGFVFHLGCGVLCTTSTTTTTYLPTLPYPTLPYPTLPYPTLPYPTLPYPTLPYPTLPYPTLPYPTLPYPTYLLRLLLLLLLNVFSALS